MARIRIGDLPEAQVLSRDHDIPVEMGGITERTSAGLLLSLLSGDAPEALDTLEKIATALGGDANFSTTITTALGQKAGLSQVVRHDAAQSLTATQKKQARSNIGALVSSVSTKTADYTVVAADAGSLISVDASAANRIITLPSLSSVGDGFPVEIKKSDTSFNTVTITGTVDGVTNKALRLPKQSAVLVSDNTSGTWRVDAEAGTVYSNSNANGEYTRFSDGTQICKLKKASWPGAPNSATGNIFKNPNVDAWTFPAEFIDALCAIAGVSSGAACWVGSTSNTSANANMSIFSATSTGSLPTVGFIAVGRWF